jgi:hypothetical protein
MNNRILGIAALIGAPFLCINTYIHVQDMGGGKMVYNTTSLSGFFDLLYISGWLCSIIGLQRLGAAGYDRFGRIIIPVSLITLGLADCWNVYEMILPNHNTILYRILDAFWPISNVVMLGVGIAVVRAKQLSGWRRFAPLACGLWLPVTALTGVIPMPGNMGLHVSNLYSAITWALLALVILTSRESERRLQTQTVLIN